LCGEGIILNSRYFPTVEALRLVMKCETIIMRLSKFEDNCEKFNYEISFENESNEIKSFIMSFI